MKFTAELRQNRSRGINPCDNNIIVDTPYCNGVSFNKIMPKGSLQKQALTYVYSRDEILHQIIASDFQEREQAATAQSGLQILRNGSKQHHQQSM